MSDISSSAVTGLPLPLSPPTAPLKLLPGVCVCVWCVWCVCGVCEFVLLVQLKDDGVKCLSKGCVYLNHLDLSGCTITSDTNTPHTLTTHIIYTLLYIYRDRSLQWLRKGCFQLHTLNILCCVYITRSPPHTFTSSHLHTLTERRSSDSEGKGRPYRTIQTDLDTSSRPRAYLAWPI